MGVLVNGIRASRRAWGRKWSFSGLFLVIFALMVLLLARLDLLPDPPAAAADGGAAAGSAAATIAATTTAVSPAVPEAPVKIEIAKIGLSATIADPATTDTNVLDALLLKGAVRYPTSAKLNEDGNVVIFGHSSYLPIVKNQAYKTFDGIQKLSAGDLITVYSSDAAYTYAVRTVAKEKASNAAIPLAVAGRVLTLSTCNSFATTDDRFVVTADFVESHPIGE
ncbi:MAG: sortase [Patescibacteria group bacterium]|nr:sortase [Patescibacteria group bacterium]MDE1943973.1 sortase [Patescibacteria group bacterium]MDE1944698.1 sortase [Patescibacteria group bacterium]MDE2057323.1 sortase [Patescibacteria group bacterium]